jgi:hypothetical protein
MRSLEIKHGGNEMLVAKIKQTGKAKDSTGDRFIVLLYRVDYINNPLTQDSLYREIEFGSMASAEGWLRDKDYPLVEERSIYSK